MAFSKAVCPACSAENTVDASSDASICKCCGTPFITAKAVEAFAASVRGAAVSNEDPEVFPGSYRITIERERNCVVRDSVTFLLILNGRPRPLADGAAVSFEENRKHFEIPVFISKNSRNRFEGVLTGIADGNDIRITWSVDPKHKALGVIKETTNNTVSFQERPGAARW